MQDERRERLRKKARKRMEEYAAEMQADPEDRRHGTVAGYQYGCRCDRCKAAASQYYRGSGRREKMAQRRRAAGVKPRMYADELLAEMQTDPGHEDHGTVKGYRRGCRCEKCAEAKMAYQRERYAKFKETHPTKPRPKPRPKTKPKTKPKCGTMAAYRRGCRCPECREANRRDRIRKEGQKWSKDAREIKEGLRRYQQWIRLGGTPTGWREWHPTRN